MSPRYLPHRDYLGLKAAFRRLVVLAGGGNEAAAQTRVGQQALDRYGSVNPEHEERFAPVDVIADLEAACGEPLITRKLAELAGYVLSPLPTNGRGSVPLTRVTAEAMHKVSKIFADLGAALENDGFINFKEDQQLHADIMAAHEVLQALDAQITLDRIKAEKERGITR